MWLLYSKRIVNAWIDKCYSHQRLWWYCNKSIGTVFYKSRNVNMMNTRRPRQFGRPFADIFKFLLHVEVVSMGLIMYNTAWHRKGDEPLSEEMKAWSTDAHMRHMRHLLSSGFTILLLMFYIMYTFLCMCVFNFRNKWPIYYIPACRAMTVA